MGEEVRDVAEGQQEATQGLTGEEVRQIVTDAVNGVIEADNAKYDGLTAQLVTLGNDIRSIASEDSEEEADADVVYVVRLDASQVDTAKSFGRVLCTEGLLLLIVCSIATGLMAWQLVSDRWRG